MTVRPTSGYFKFAVLIVALGPILVGSKHGVGGEPIRAVSKASCGSQDRTESVSGETTLAERFSSGPDKAYSCNLELIGQFQGEGAAADLEVLDDCAYYSTAPNPQMQHPGVAVLDVSDSRHPHATAYLDSVAMLAAHESLSIDRTRRLLLASKLPDRFDIYDLSADCRYPILKNSLSIPSLFSHIGAFTTDGRTYYGAKWPPDPKTPPASAVFALDIRQPSNPHVLSTWIPPNMDWITHAVSVNKDGTRAYVALKRFDDDAAKASSPNGLVILDTSEIQARRTNARIHLVSTLFWDDTHEAEQVSAPVLIQGRPYLLFEDGIGAIGFHVPPPAGVCDSGRPGHGFARIIDIGDEKHPRTASKLMLEVADPANCSKVMYDPTLFGAYGSFACSANYERDGKLVACAYFEGGLRVFDIRDPLHPKEVAYYKPPARRSESHPGSLFFTPTGPGTSPPDHTADSVITVPWFRNNGEEIWFTSEDNGFQVVRFSDRFRTDHPELFPRP
jgi:hypothetical protein